MQIHLVDPIPGISAEAATINAGENSAEVTIHIGPTSDQHSSIPLRFRAVGRMDDNVKVISEATTTLNPHDNAAAN